MSTIIIDPMIYIFDEDYYINNSDNCLEKLTELIDLLDDVKATGDKVLWTEEAIADMYEFFPYTYLKNQKTELEAQLVVLSKSMQCIDMIKVNEKDLSMSFGETDILQQSNLIIYDDKTYEIVKKHWNTLGSYIWSNEELDLIFTPNTFEDGLFRIRKSMMYKELKVCHVSSSLEKCLSDPLRIYEMHEKHNKILCENRLQKIVPNNYYEDIYKCPDLGNIINNGGYASPLLESDEWCTKFVNRAIGKDNSSMLYYIYEEDHKKRYVVFMKTENNKFHAFNEFLDTRIPKVFHDYFMCLLN